MNIRGSCQVRPDLRTHERSIFPQALGDIRHSLGNSRNRNVGIWQFRARAQFPDAPLLPLVPGGVGVFPHALQNAQRGGLWHRRQHHSGRG